MNALPQVRVAQARLSQIESAIAGILRAHDWRGHHHVFDAVRVIRQWLDMQSGDPREVDPFTGQTKSAGVIDDCDFPFPEIRRMAERRQLSDCDTYTAWLLGLDAYTTAKMLGAQFPHDPKTP